VRLTVVAGTRRADVAVPGTIPVAELLPALVRSVGLLEPATVHGGYRVVTLEGRVLSGDADLVNQGVEDGDLLALAAGAEEQPPRAYDDVVEAATEVAERDRRPLDPVWGRRTARTAAALLLGFATTAGLLGAGRASSALPLTAAGCGALLTGLVGLAGLDAGRALMIPPVVAGTVFLATGLAVRVAGFDPAVVLTTVLVLAVMAGSVFPWLALESTGTRVEPLHSTADITADPAEIDPDRVGAGLRAAHAVLLGLSASVGLLLVLIAPVAVSLGRAGTAIAVLAALVLVLRTRQYLGAPEVLAGWVSGVVGLVSVAGSLLWLHPDWRPAAAAVLAAGGGVLLAGTLRPPGPSVRLARLGDVAESGSLLLLPPLLVVAVGLLDSVRG
jgi:hypothetical protein